MTHRPRQARPHEPIYADAVYSREEAAELLGVSLSTVKRLIATGTLEASRPGGLRRVFVKGSAILRMLDETRIHARS
jgi:excisionase family DNA binding protein